MMNSILPKHFKQILIIALLAGGMLCSQVLLTSAHSSVDLQFIGKRVENEKGFSDFEAHLETVRQTLKIPGLSAAVVRDQELVWASGFGYADLENQLPATPDTPYGLASVTKPIAATLIMQLVEEGLVDLDAPAAQYGVNHYGEIVTVRHLMTHTSEGVPGTRHSYNGNRYGHLGGVIEGAAGKSFAELLSDRFLLPLGMYSSALNPINSWGGSSLSVMDDLRLATGWGERYRHFSGVYQRLAKPYQLDSQNNLIPGMYQIYHNPAAGMISSVSDLAKFDIALDRGLLLDEQAKAEMFTPAYATIDSRDDLMYGLGWYIQDFDGLQLLWHSGRWSPSTSALYLKVPEQDLTFIVLANTANLTTPFDGIGHGDVSKSLLALCFYRYFIYPEKYGADLPAIDWALPENFLVNQLTQSMDESTRMFLERELWAFRQAYASVGERDQVEKLKRVNLRAFPDSAMRRDRLFTKTVGGFPVIPAALSASAFQWLSRAIVLWLFLVLFSTAWVLGSLVRREDTPKAQWIYWLLAAVFMGPFAVLVLARTRSSSGGAAPSIQRQALVMSTFAVGVYAVGWGLAFSFLMRLGGNPHPVAILATTYLTPLFLSLVFLRIPGLLSRGLVDFKRRLTRSMWGELISMNIAFAVMFPLTMLLENRVYTTIPSSLLFTWSLLSILTVVNLIGQYPAHLWMMRRGFMGWRLESAEERTDYVFPGKKSAWSGLAVSLLILIGALALTISQLA